MRNGLENGDEDFVPLDLSRSGARFSTCPSIISSFREHENIPCHFVECPLEVPKDLPLSTQTGEMLSYIAIYNLALAWHLWGYKTFCLDEKRLFLGKALSLYRLAHGIMSSGGTKAGPSHYMALVCNTGHANYCLGNTERANACFQLLLETLMCVVDQGSQCACEFLDGFISNIVSLVLAEQSAPAA